MLFCNTNMAYIKQDFLIVLTIFDHRFVLNEKIKKILTPEDKGGVQFHPRRTSKLHFKLTSNYASEINSRFVGSGL